MSPNGRRGRRLKERIEDPAIMRFSVRRQELDVRPAAAPFDSHDGDVARQRRHQRLGFRRPLRTLAERMMTSVGRIGAAAG